MKAGIISFTGSGGKWNRILCAGLQEKGIQADGYHYYRDVVEGLRSFTELAELAKDLFVHCDALIFIGAAGIAVRTAAPLLKSKILDPAVVVMDDSAVYAVSLLSGHLGGANELTRQIAAITGALPVITTATDIHGLFAVDTWAVENRLLIHGMKEAKLISAAVLAGKKIELRTEYAYTGILPECLVQGEEAGDAELLLLVAGQRAVQAGDGKPVLWLQPRNLVAGIGCRKGKSAEELGCFMQNVFEDHSLSIERLEKMTSIINKAGEAGLIEAAGRYLIPFETYTAEELGGIGIQGLDREFRSSAFVEQTVGVDNVCERSAFLGSGRGRQRVAKIAGNGMTAAVYEREVILNF